MPYFKALNRPFLWCRVEKTFFFMNLLCSFPIAWSCMFMSLWADAVAFIFFITGHAVGIMVTREDPLMFALYIRHIKYKRYYLAQPTVHSPLAMMKDSVPVYEGKGGVA